MYDSPLLHNFKDGVITLAISRPEIHNAFDAQLITGIASALTSAEQNPDVSVIVLTAIGETFSAGADLNYMQEMVGASEAENIQDAMQLATLMRTLQFLRKPTIARINGSAFGGGVGLIACCDIAIAADSAKFALSETKLGLIPAVISPYVIDAIGLREARRWFMSAETFDANTAVQIGLVHKAVVPAELDQAVFNQIKLLKAAGPVAVSEAKALAFSSAGVNKADRQALDNENAKLIARLRVSAEGQEGLNAFLQKRKPNWLV